MSSEHIRLKKIQAKVEGQEELLDLMGKHLTYVDGTVRPDSSDLARHYLARRTFLLAAWNDKQHFVTRLLQETA